jgi:hypothetical protein
VPRGLAGTSWLYLLSVPGHTVSLVLEMSVHVHQVSVCWIWVPRLCRNCCGFVLYMHSMYSTEQLLGLAPPLVVLACLVSQRKPHLLTVRMLLHSSVVKMKWTAAPFYSCFWCIDRLHLSANMWVYLGLSVVKVSRQSLPQHFV